MDVANKEGGFVVGTGDLSELALGWCTYNGDHMSMYAVNTSIPKTLVRSLVNEVGHFMEVDGFVGIAPIIDDIIDTPVSPELLPPNPQTARSTNGRRYSIRDSSASSSSETVCRTV